MKTIFQIGRLEIKTLFSTPVAWLLMLVFAVQTGLGFIEHFSRSLLYQGEGNLNNDLTFIIFSNNNSGLCFTIENSLFYYVPLITMGLISREISSGSIKLLLSSPIRIGQIVLGKFLAVMSYWLMILLIFWVFVLAGYFTIDNIDLWTILSGTSGIFLLAAVYSAIGLFMSSVTSYQVVAAISTLVILSIFNFIGGMWQGIPYLRNISWFLDTKQHTFSLINGLIVTRDLWYFVTLTIIFLVFTILFLKSKTESKPSILTVGKFALTAAAFIAGGYLVSLRQVTGYFDVTRGKVNTASVASREIFSRLKGPVEITGYDNLFSVNRPMGVSELKNRNSLRKAWEPYERFFPSVKFSYVGFYDSVKNSPYFRDDNKSLEEKAMEIAKERQVDKKNYLPPAVIRKIADLSVIGNHSAWSIMNNGKKTYLESSIGGQRPFDAENDIATAFKRLTTAAPMIAFLTGHNERSPTDQGDKNYSGFATDRVGGNPLINYGFDVCVLSPDKPLPSGIDILVIADPLTPYSKDEREKIGAYINRGGNLVIAGEPGKGALLNPIMDSLGVQLMGGMLVGYSPDYSPDLIFPGFDTSAALCRPEFAQFRADHQQVFLQGAAGIGFEPGSSFNSYPVLTTDCRSTWNKMGDFKPDTGKLVYDSAAGDTKSAINAAVALTRKVAGKQQRIMVLGDADLFSNAQVFRELDNMVNHDFIFGIFRWLSYGQFPVEISRPEKKSLILINHKGARRMKLLLMGLLPAIILLSGFIYLNRRKRK